MFTSFSTALSALTAHSTAVDVVGNNLANLNTPGFKANVVAFHDLVTQSLGAGGAGLGETQIGFGVARPLTLRQFTQGAIKASTSALDVAIQGDGFLILKDATTNATYYTRGGNLQVDKSGYLITPTGQRVQGWMDNDGTLTTNGPCTDLVLPVGSLRAASATQTFSFNMNLNSAGAAGETFNSSIEIYDSLGQGHTVGITFTKDATTPNKWAYSMKFPDSDVKTAIAPVTGTLTFDSSGMLTDPAADKPVELSITGLKSGAADFKVNWEIYDGDTPRITQLAQKSAVSANQQDGSAPAQLVRVGIAESGTILAQWSNGVQSTVGQLAMAAIRNPESLVSVGDNNYTLSARSALPAIGTSGTGGRGNIIGSATESSTVDIAREFTNLITLQRGYQANARVITTVDEMSQETINLKR
ncbi:MAG: flagellar hook protein FlgE [Bryobacterales bacterium]|nr:flagellar hook protein FlgE [Bryobacterales bacterium]